jgi:hypothetical protein
MTRLVKYESVDGAFMWVETHPPGGSSDVGLVAEESGETKALTRLEDSLASVRGASVALMSTVTELRERSEGVKLDEVSLEVSLSFGVEGGVIVAKGSAKAEASVTLTWRAPKEA